MKKLMFTVAMAAMSAGAFAGVAQVYDMAINVKTTECKDGKKLITDKCGNSFRYYRTQASYKFEGKFWGCGCAVIANPIQDQYGRPRLNTYPASEIDCDNNNNSYMFWGKKAAFHNVEFTWSLLQLVGPKSENIEGVFAANLFLCKDSAVESDPALIITGAGYGTAKIDDCQTEGYEYLLNELKQMNGSVVGIYNVVDAAGMVGCVYCGETTECGPFQFCPCVDVLDEQSAAYGTFTIKYNSSLTKKVMNGKYIDEAYKFPSFVTEEFECIAKETPEPGPEEQVVANYKAAVQALNVANQGLVTAETQYNLLFPGNETEVEKEAREAIPESRNAARKTEALGFGIDMNTGYWFGMVGGNTKEEMAKQFAEMTKFQYEGIKQSIAQVVDFELTVAQVKVEMFELKFAGLLTNRFTLADSASNTWDTVASYTTLVDDYLTKQCYYEELAAKAEIGVKYYPEATAAAVTAAQSAMNTAKTKMDENYKILETQLTAETAKAKCGLTASVAARVLAVVDSTQVALEGLNQKIIAYNDLMIARYGAYYKATDGMTTKQINEAKKAASDAVTEAKKAVTAAKENLAQAETACLIVKGNKECK